MARVNILSVRAQHAFAYEDVTFDFTSGIHNITGENGTSKSSLFMVLSQCFYNKNPKDIKVPDVSNDVTKQPFEIEVELDIDNVRYRILNSKRGSGKISIFKGDSTKSCAPKGIPATLKMIEELLRADYATFVDMCYRSSKSSLDILEESGDAKRKKFVEGILDFNLLDEKLAAAKQKAKDHERVKLTLGAKHAALLGTRLQMREVEPLMDADSIQGKIDATQGVIDTKISDLATANAEKSALIGQLRRAEESANLQDRIVWIANKLTGFDSPHKTLSSALSSRVYVMDNLAVANAEIKTCHATIKTLVKPKAPELVCSKCGQDLGKEAAQTLYEEDLVTYESDYCLAAIALDKATGESSVLSTELHTVELEITKWEAKLKLEREQTNLMARCQSIGDYDSLDDEVSAVSAKVSLLEIDLNRARVMLTEWKKDLSIVEAHNTTQAVNARFNTEAANANAKAVLEIDQLDIDIAKEDVKLGLAKEWVHHYGPKGMRVHKMELFLQLLNDRMGKYSDMVCGGSISCSFYISEEGKIEVRILDSDKSKPYANWSDGEKERVKLPCLFAILEILGIKGDCSFNLLFLDEVFGALDESGREGLFRTFEYLKEQGACVYTIAHTPIANEVTYDSTYLATKVDGISTICEITSQPTT